MRAKKKKLCVAAAVFSAVLLGSFVEAAPQKNVSDERVQDENASDESALNESMQTEDVLNRSALSENALDGYFLQQTAAASRSVTADGDGSVVLPESQGISRSDFVLMRTVLNVIETQLKSEMEIGIKPESETESGTDSEMEAGTEAEPESKTEAETEMETKAMPESETETKAMPESETESETETEPAHQPVSCSASAIGYNDGLVTVTVTLDPDGTITEVRIDDCSSQTDTIGQIAAPAVARQIEKAQSAQVDGVTGATYTSDAVKEAAKKAIRSARDLLWEAKNQT